MPITETSLLHGVSKIAPSLLSVARRSYELKQLTNLFEVDLEADDALSPMRRHLQKVNAIVSASGTSAKQLNEFLGSHDFETFLRQLVANHIEGADCHRKLAKKLKALLVEQSVVEGNAAARTAAVSLLAALQESTALMWNAAAENGLVAQEKAATCTNSRLLADELSALRSELAEEVLLSPKEYRAYEKFLSDYRESVGKAFRYITHPSFTDTKPIPFDELYVAANFQEYSPSSSAGSGLTLTPHSQEEGEPLRPSSLLDISFRTVILGDPGAGKSTFAAKLCHDLWKYPDTPLFGGRVLVPVLVVLRDYAKMRKEQPCSVLEYIEQRSRVDHQHNPPERAFHRLFITGRALVIFDGLDELLDTADRVEIKNSVERFSDLYPSLSILVTSRVVGYEQAPLDPTLYSVFRLLPFNNEQVEEYARKWFPICSFGTVEQRKQRAKQFLTESTIIGDLRQNPLMLALLCNLYKQDGYLPRYRPDIYQRCADLLFEKWDKGRQISPEIPIDFHLRPIMCHLAHWIYQSKGLQTGVTEQELVEETASYLRDFFEQEARARSYAKQIVEFFRGRAWVFSDTGSNALERLYQFTHRTFLEYFTAEYLVGACKGPDGLGSILLPRIERREWDTVSLLAYQMQSKQYKSAADDLLEGILIRAAKISDPSLNLNLILFAVRALHVIHPKLTVRRDVTAVALRCLVSNAHKRHGGRTVEEDLLDQIGQAVVSLEDETGNPITTMVFNLLTSLAGGDGHEFVLSVIKIITMMPSFADGSGIDKPGARERYDRWREAADEALGPLRETRLELSAKDVEIAVTCWMDKLLSTEKIISFHGVWVLFRSRQVAFRSARFVSVANMLHWDLLGLSKSASRTTAAVRPFIQGMLQAPLPWKEARVIRWKKLPAEDEHIEQFLDLYPDKAIKWPKTMEQRTALALLAAVQGTADRFSAVPAPIKAINRLLELRNSDSMELRETAAVEMDAIIDGLHILPEAALRLKAWSRLRPEL